MKTWSRLIVLSILAWTIFLAEGASAGESGVVICTFPRCHYKITLNIGGTRNNPAVTGYCPREKKFVRVKLKSHEDAGKPQRCPNDGAPLVLIKKGSDVSRIPCPECGKLALRYEMKLRKD